jgi:cell wall assembly regulator SMI1
MKIKWDTYLWDEPRPMEQGELEAVEAEWGVRLPEDYKRTAALHQGMTPDPCVFNVGRGTTVFCTLLTASRHEGKESYSIQDAYAVIRPHVPPGIYPFALTSGGEDICFDYRESPDQPRIALVTTEMSIHTVANSFQEFMDRLYDD